MFNPSAANPFPPTIIEDEGRRVKMQFIPTEDCMSRYKLTFTKEGADVEELVNNGKLEELVSEYLGSPAVIHHGDHPEYIVEIRFRPDKAPSVVEKTTLMALALAETKFKDKPKVSVRG